MTFPESKPQKIICLIGRPGSGKSLVNDWFSKHTQYHSMATGDLCRTFLKEQSQLGDEVRKYLNAGKLLPDELIFKLILKEQSQFKELILLDGFPRTKPQLKLFFDLKPTYYQFLILDCPEEVTLNRLQGRRICPKCQRVYHVLFLKPKVPGHCDNDHEKLVIRGDDDFNKIPQRMATYNEKTLPMVTEIITDYPNETIILNSNCSKIELHQKLTKIFLK